MQDRHKSARTLNASAEASHPDRRYQNLHSLRHGIQREDDEFFHEKSKKTQSLPADTCLLFGSGRHLSQNKIWPQKFCFMHVLQSLEGRCSNKYSLLKLTGNEDNYFPLRSGVQCRLSADFTDCGSGNCWPWPHLIWAAVSLFKGEEYIEDWDFQEIILI